MTDNKNFDEKKKVLNEEALDEVAGGLLYQHTWRMRCSENDNMTMIYISVYSDSLDIVFLYPSFCAIIDNNLVPSIYRAVYDCKMSTLVDYGGISRTWFW